MTYADLLREELADTKRALRVELIALKGDIAKIQLQIRALFDASQRMSEAIDKFLQEAK